MGRSSECKLRLLLNTGEQSAMHWLTQSTAERFCLLALREQSLIDLHDLSTVEISVQLVDQEHMQALNLQYRGKDSPTNVLSFEADLPVFVDEDSDAGTLLVLGDLVLCESVVMQEASEQGKRLEDHWTHLLIHGTLHLCGHDHETAEQAEAMESLEIQLLSSLGIPDPYGIRE